MKRQYHVCVHDEKERKEAIAFLEKNGYQNIQRLTVENYTFPVFVIEDTFFFGTNTTCMAALAVKGVRAISWAEFMRLQESKA